MLFNSYVFLLCFLPATLLIYQLVSRFHRKAVVIWLGVASLIFYGYWRPQFLFVLGASVLFNYLISCLISRTIANSISTRVLLWMAIVVNLGALCYFKYLFPLLGFFSRHLHNGHQWRDVLLPLGISFFTFTQIAFLVDLQQGAAVQQDFFSYLLFVTFFPHLIAGPILHHKDIMPQFQQERDYGLQWSDLAVGFSWFAMGLFKKVILADRLAPAADMIFGASGLVRPQQAWVAAISYTLQLYFDFSGYCDMALGLARMFSIDFPLNFSSPYKAASIIEFWQRWHITLSEYIGSYLYSPIQFWVSGRRQSQGKKVSRKAQATVEGFAQMVAFPTLTAMFIAGIWHGAGLQFLVFGLLHGTYLTVNHGWRIWRHHRGFKPAEGVAAMGTRVLSTLITFLCVVVSLVFFRSAGLHDAMRMLEQMALLHHGTDMGFVLTTSELAKLITLMAAVWVLPNTQQMLARYKPALHLAPTDEGRRWIPVYWTMSLPWGMALGVAVFVALVLMQNPSTFLYFQF